jgi:type IV secretory pathway TraG/TraD family ATPase VirD4
VQKHEPAEDLWGRTPDEQRAGLWGFLRKNLLPISGLLLVIGLMILGNRLRLGERHKTTGRMATPQEELAQYGSVWGEGGYILGRQILKGLLGIERTGEVLRLTPEQRLSHTLIEAGPGAGKTSGLFIPQLLEDSASCLFNAYIVDRKSPEIYYQIYLPWEQKGHRVIFFDPWRPDLTCSFEPLWDASIEDIEAMVEAHIQVSLDPNSTLRHYQEMNRRVLRALFKCAREWGRCKGRVPNVECKCRYTPREHESEEVRDCGCKCRRHFCTLPAVAELIALGWKATRAAIESTLPEENRFLSNMWEMRHDRLAEMWTGLAGRLELYRQPLPAAAFSRSDFRIEDIVTEVKSGSGGRRTLLVVGAPQSHGDHATLVASLMTQLIAKRVYLRRDEMAACGARWQDVIPLAVFLDEFGTYPVPGVEDFIATARSGAAGIIAALQHREQLIQFYGRESVNRMTTYFRTQVILRGCHSKVAREVSDRCGKKLVYDSLPSRSSGGSWRNGRTVSHGESIRTVEVPVICPDEIEFMPLDRALVIGSTRASWVKLVRYFAEKALNRAVKLSEREARIRAKANVKCDSEKQSRQRGEPRRLIHPRFNWAAIAGVEQAIRGGSDQLQPMNTKQDARINAKLRDLGMTAKRDRMALEVCGKPFSDLTKADAQDLIRHLEDIESETEKNKKNKAGKGEAP